MKLFLNLVFAIALVAFVGCGESGQTTSSQNTIEPNGSEPAAAFDVDATNAEIDQIIAEHNARIAKVGNIKAKKNDISVPSDYATIQGAVDAASEGTNIRVHAGTYTENVVITTPGIEIKAVGNVTLNGRFIANADGVSIRNFIIDVVVGSGIVFYNSDGNEAKNNSISNAYVGIFVINCENTSVKINTVQSCDGGIVISESSACTVKANKSFENNQGVFLQVSSSACEVKSNECTSNLYNGITLTGSSSSNDVKANKCNENGSVGIILYPGSDNNTVEENEALYNGACDIVNGGTGNTFNNNNADCTSGL